MNSRKKSLVGNNDSVENLNKNTEDRNSFEPSEYDTSFSNDKVSIDKKLKNSIYLSNNKTDKIVNNEDLFLLSKEMKSINELIEVYYYYDKCLDFKKANLISFFERLSTVAPPNTKEMKKSAFKSLNKSSMLKIFSVFVSKIEKIMLSISSLFEKWKVTWAELFNAYYLLSKCQIHSDDLYYQIRNVTLF